MLESFGSKDGNLSECVSTTLFQYLSNFQSDDMLHRNFSSPDVTPWIFLQYPHEPGGFNP